MLKERPYELNQKFKRMRDSRDNLKTNNREKMQQNKALRDRNVELTQSRDLWKSRSRELERALRDQKEDLIRQIETANQTTEDASRRAERERERADLLQIELEEVKKKHEILRALFRK